MILEIQPNIYCENALYAACGHILSNRENIGLLPVLTKAAKTL